MIILSGVIIICFNHEDRDRYLKQEGNIMDQMLFRGKSIKDGKWVYGWYVKYKDKHRIYTEEEYEDQTFPPGMIQLVQEFYDVQGDTVGQWTGLVDKCLKKIFFGDIVLYRNFYKGYSCCKCGYQHVKDATAIVIWQNGYSSGSNHHWQASARYCLKYDNGSEYPLEEDEALEVIGNIHDNYPAAAIKRAQVTDGN